MKLEEILHAADSFNGGGHPREINLGPHDHVVTQEDADEVAACEEIVGVTVTILGYGCY